MDLKFDNLHSRSSNFLNLGLGVWYLAFGHFTPIASYNACWIFVRVLS
jgi:hypothetical protein